MCDAPPRGCRERRGRSSRKEPLECCSGRPRARALRKSRACLLGAASRLQPPIARALDNVGSRRPSTTECRCPRLACRSGRRIRAGLVGLRRAPLPWRSARSASSASECLWAVRSSNWAHSHEILRRPLASRIGCPASGVMRRIRACTLAIGAGSSCSIRWRRGCRDPP